MRWRRRRRLGLKLTDPTFPHAPGGGAQGSLSCHHAWLHCCHSLLTIEVLCGASKPSGVDCCHCASPMIMPPTEAEPPMIRSLSAGMGRTLQAKPCRGPLCLRKALP